MALTKEDAVMISQLFGEQLEKQLEKQLESMSSYRVSICAWTDWKSV